MPYRVGDARWDHAAEIRQRFGYQTRLQLRKRSPPVSGWTYQLRYIRCGKPTCHCATGRGHGPYWMLL